MSAAACRVLLPGNPGICGFVPGALEAVQLRINGSEVLKSTSFGACSAANNSASDIVVEANLTRNINTTLVGLAPRYACMHAHHLCTAYTSLMHSMHTMCAQHAHYSCIMHTTYVQHAHDSCTACISLVSSILSMHIIHI